MIPELTVVCERLSCPQIDRLRQIWQRHGDMIFIALGYALAIGILVLIGLRYPMGRIVQG